MNSVTMSEASIDYDEKRLRQLTVEKCIGTLSEAEAEELSKILAASSQGRSEYWQLISIHSQLEWEYHHKRANADELARQIASSPDSVEPLSESETSSPFSSRARPWLLALAACLLVGWFLGIFEWGDSTQNLSREIVAERAIDQPIAEPTVVGTLAAVAPDSRWSLGRSGGSNASEMRQGDTIKLYTGAVELRLPSDTVALLEAPAVMNVVSLDRVRMLQGGVKVEVAKGDEGFTVETDSAEVIDLGTVFSVSVENGNTDLVVFDGEVDLKSQFN